MKLPQLVPGGFSGIFAAESENSTSSLFRDVPRVRTATLLFSSASEYKKPSLKDEDLDWLWGTCVKPVLETLRTEKVAMKDGDALPRLWWIGSGFASSLPFHAARSSGEAGGDSLTEMIPSYTPSIKALQYSRSQSQNYLSRFKNYDPSHLQKIVVSTMRTTPGYIDLQGVHDEKDAICSALSGHFDCEWLQQPIVEAVEQEIQEADIKHFACHGTFDHEDP